MGQDLEKSKQNELILVQSLLKKQNAMLGDSLLHLNNLLYLHKSISLLEFREIKKVIIEKLPYILSIQYFTLFLYDKNKKQLTLACHNHPNLPEQLTLHLDDSGIMRDALINGRYILEVDFFKSKYFKGKRNPLYQNAFFVCVPLMIESEILGVLNLNDNEKGFFTINDLDFVLNITEFISLSISNSLLFAKAETLSVTDGLTSLYNRPYMQNMLNGECTRSTRYDSPLSLVMLDVDHFKRVNDTYGHQKGDEILIEVAALMKRFCRANDVAARYGGEEFILVLPETKLAGAMQIAERVRQELAGHVFRNGEEEFRVTISCGVAEFDRERLYTATKLMKCADDALYEAKKGGRNRVVVGKADGTTTT